MTTEFTWPKETMTKIDAAFMASQIVFGYTKEELLSYRKKGDAPMARHCITWYMKKFIKIPFYLICPHVNRKSHATLMHSHKVVETAIEVRDKKYFPMIITFMNLADSLQG
jgi:chromosomal replication initiation ATPase DnaA